MLEALNKVGVEYDLREVVRTIKIDDELAGEDTREGFKLYYSVNDNSRPLYGRYWVQHLEPGKKIYEEVALTGDEIKDIVTWLKK